MQTSVTTSTATLKPATEKYVDHFVFNLFFSYFQGNFNRLISDNKQ